MKEMEEYRAFTTPAELHKAVNTLRGIVAGINSDASVENSEIQELTHWCKLHAHLRDRHPFSEIIPVVERACEDGVITEDESKDILWLCNNFADSNSYYDAITSSIQFLSGMIHGIMADGESAHSIDRAYASHRRRAWTPEHTASPVERGNAPTSQRH